jgi:adenylosuccinate synthase
LKQAIKISGTNKLIINKCDILQNINKYKIITDDQSGPSHINFIDFDSMKNYILNELQDHCEIIFSGSESSI